MITITKMVLIFMNFKSDDEIKPYLEIYYGKDEKKTDEGGKTLPFKPISFTSTITFKDTVPNIGQLLFVLKHKSMLKDPQLATGNLVLAHLPSTASTSTTYSVALNNKHEEFYATLTFDITYSSSSSRLLVNRLNRVLSAGETSTPKQRLKPAGYVIAP